MFLLPKRSALLALALLPLFAATAALADEAPAGQPPTGQPSTGQPSTGEPPTGEHSGGGPRSKPCRADLQKFCAGVEPGGGRIVACLKQHEAELSPACQAAWAAHQKKHPNAGAPEAAPAK